MLNVPPNFTAGDRVVWFTDPILATNKETGQAITIAPPTFTLSFAFRGVATLNITAINDNGRFKSIIPSATSQPLQAGILSWQGYVTDPSGDRTTLEAGQTLVIANLAQSITVPASPVEDLQTKLDRVNAAIDALLTGKPVAEYEINGRKLKYISLADLTVLRQQLTKELYRAQSAALKAAGKNRRRSYIRFDGSSS